MNDCRRADDYLGIWNPIKYPICSFLQIYLTTKHRLLIDVRLLIKSIAFKYKYIQPSSAFPLLYYNFYRLLISTSLDDWV